MKLRPCLFALVLAVPLAVSAAPAKKEAAPKTTPEQEAVIMFYDMCVKTHGKVDAITEQMKSVESQKAGNAIPADALTKETGIKADHAWALQVGASRQKLLLTTVPGICALHTSSGDGKLIKTAFLNAAKHLAAAAKATLKPIEEKKQGGANFASYAVTADGKPNEIVFGLSTADKPAPSGTKHLMTYSVVKKDQGKS